MGLLKAGIGALSGVLADQWREYFYCDSLDANTICVKGQKRITGRGSNYKGTENIISNGSIVAVNEGQCMLIVDQGKVVEVCAEPGEFVYDSSSEPSIFYGGLGKGILNTFKSIGKRFTFGGDAPKDQRIYFFNTKEIMGNKYGTANPVPFRVVDKNAGIDIDISIRCNGEYSYKITDPLLFYTNVCGNVADAYKRDQIDSMLKSELMTALQPAFAKISDQGIRYSSLPGHTMEIADALNEVLSSKWGQLRGISVASFGVNSVSASPEDEQMLKEMQKNVAYKDMSYAFGSMVNAQNEAMRTAAGNKGGASLGFMNMNMAQQTGGINLNSMMQMAQQQQMMQQQAAQPAPAAPVADSWTCQCGQINTGMFCQNCGTKKPEPQPAPAGNTWTCQCGSVNTGMFCPNCGTKKPTPVVYKCDKCGWTPEDPTNPPKFCPNCGDPFNANDAQ